MDNNTNTNNSSGKNTDNVVGTVNLDSRHNNKGVDKRKNTDISPFTSEDDEDNNHKGNIKTKTKEKPTRSKHDKVAAGTTGANVTAAEDIILQHDGTYIRAILTYISEISRDNYTSTNNQLTKDKLDSRAGHSDAYGEKMMMMMTSPNRIKRRRKRQVKRYLP